MYSMVLLAALTTTVDTPDRGGRRGGGCCGCYGGGYGGCYGGYGGGCYGGGWGGGYGGCYGGGYGGCYGGYAMGGWGGGYGGYAFAPSVGMSYAPTYASLPTMNGTPIASLDGTQPYQSFYAGAGGQADLGDRARLVVRVPDNARVTVDGEPTQSTGATRTFISPSLKPDQTYHYTVKATMNNADGEPITRTQNVQVWAGKTSEATFSFNKSDDRSERLKNPPVNDEDNPTRKRSTDRDLDKK